MAPKNLYGVSMTVVDFDAEIRRAELEAEQIVEDDLNAKIDFAVKLLRHVTPVKTGYARSRWKARKNYFVPGGEITNDAEYIVYLNQGSSKQAPAYFIEQVLLTAKLI